MELIAKGKSLWNIEISGEPIILDDDSVLNSNMCQGKIIVTHIPSPDIVVCLDNALAIVTETGGLLCHAAVLALEMGCPIVVAAGGVIDAVKNKNWIQISCTDGEGCIYA